MLPIDPQLLEKFYRNECSDAEHEQLMHWMAQATEKDVAEVLSIFEQRILSGEIKRNTQIDLPFEQISQQIIEPKPKRSFHFYWAASIAAILVSVVLVTMYFLPSDQQHIASIITHSTKQGEIKSIVLPDSSVIWLNAESTISYTDPFAAHKREVQLNGEAFFNVTPDQNRPFSIISKQLQTTVLGTSFNIYAYQGEPDIITVSTGKVKVTYNDQQLDTNVSTVFLTPGQQAMLDEGKQQLTVSAVDEKLYSEWINNELVFNEIPFEQALKMLERQFAVRITCKNEDILKRTIRASYKTDSLKAILEDLQFILDFEYVKLQDAIIITTK